MPALYRTYRPKRFSEVVGQAPIVRALKNAVIRDQPSHAYLFCGGRGLGKTTLARVLARALNCTEVKDGESCLTCRVCREIEAGSFLDLLEVDAASNTGVDNVRSLIETVRFQPTSGKYKMYIIDEAHMLSKGAWNALLKTLEEPPPHTVFVLATTESGKVPATINSRAQRFDFSKFSEPELELQITSVLAQENAQVDPAIVNLIARMARGGMRDALTLLDQVLSLGESTSISEAESLLGVTSKELLLELLHIIHQGSGSDLPPYFARLNGRYFDMLAVNRDLLELLRELLMYRLAPSLMLMPEPARDWFSEQDLLFLIRQYLRSYKEIATAPEASLPLLIASVEAHAKLQGSSAGGAAAGPAVRASAGPSAQAIFEQSEAGGGTISAEGGEIARDDILPTSPVSAAGGSSPVPISDLDEAQVREMWPLVCTKLKEINGPLATLLRNSPISRVEGSCVSLGVKYLFHKEQLESTRNKQLIAECLKTVFGQPVMLIARFVEREESMADPAETLTDALRIFGGELIE